MPLGLPSTEVVCDLLARFGPEAADRYMDSFPDSYLEVVSIANEEEATADPGVRSRIIHTDGTSATTTTEEHAAATTTDNQKKMSKRQRQRAKKKTARERAFFATASRPATTKDAPTTAGAAPEGADAAAPGQSRRTSTDRVPTPIPTPPASPAPSYAEVLQRPSSAMSCASAASEHSSTDYDTDDGFQTVDGRAKRRRRASPQQEEPLPASTSAGCVDVALTDLFYLTALLPGATDKEQQKYDKKVSALNKLECDAQATVVGSLTSQVRQLLNMCKKAKDMWDKLHNIRTECPTVQFPEKWLRQHPQEAEPLQDMEEESEPPTDEEDITADTKIQATEKAETEEEEIREVVGTATTIPWKSPIIPGRDNVKYPGKNGSRSP
ncbi:hypothetical protein ILUMI_03451 [Ignelater luminosus]|uniref:Uncharacterized protein n=1 Tax=Ignelater luminosus TaxID=2038154 RepID=A0A8K0GM62_IGNLU|nr:hypothetical protein ILUMI_03451 [Ignelater luminosus]